MYWQVLKMSRADNFRQLLKEIETTKKATQKLVLASEISKEDYKDLLDLYPKWEVGINVSPNDPPYEYQGSLYKVVQAHKTQADWTPDKVASLFTRVEPSKDKDGAEVVPDFRKPTGAHDAYKKGDKVLFDGKIYQSRIDANVYSPTEYPAGWELIEG